MITSKELMIGDWYAFLGHPYKCTASDIAALAEYEENGVPTDISEIPLTAEILEKNGFTRFGTDYILKERHFGLENPSIPSNYLDNYWLRVSIKAVHIEYVHQLQHALRLCEIEKEIKL